MWQGRITIAIAVATLAACGSSGSSVSTADARRLADIDQLDPGGWHDLQRRDYPDPIIATQCGVRDVQRDSASTVASSPVAGYWPPVSRQYIGQAPPSRIAQLTVATYPNDDAASAAARAPGDAAFGDCIFRAVEQYDRSTGIDPAENEFRRDDGRNPRSDIITSSTNSDANGELMRILQAQFSDEVLGGTDNSHDVIETIGQSGRVVVTLFLVTSSQQGDPSGTRAIAEQMTARAMKRVDAATSSTRSLTFDGRLTTVSVARRPSNSSSLPSSRDRCSHHRLPEGEREVVDIVDGLDAAGVAQRRQVGTGLVEADHPLVVGDAHEQRAVGVTVADQRVDLEGGPARIRRVDEVAVVDDALEHRQGPDPHGTILT